MGLRHLRITLAWGCTPRLIFKQAKPAIINPTEVKPQPNEEENKITILSHLKCNKDKKRQYNDRLARGTSNGIETSLLACYFGRLSRTGRILIGFGLTVDGIWSGARWRGVVPRA